ncbi:MAG: hypothetical protein JWN89_367 [Parcubacteria group bacterium]|nr:hypothetical protein [Parcubacteria group bacterium]
MSNPKSKGYKSPAEIQSFLNSLPFNFEKKGETCRSVEESLKAGTAHCFEGALIGAAELQKLGHKPLLLDLKTTKDDFEHVVALFKVGGCWGAISKTNHAVLRYREPVYKNVHELVMSYFHEYFLPSGAKTLRSYSKPFDLRKFGDEWITGTMPLWHIDKALDRSPHTNLLIKGQIKNLRRADPIEIKAGEIVEYHR